MCFSWLTTRDLSLSTLTIHVYIAGPAQAAKHLLTTTRPTHDRSTRGNFGLRPITCPEVLVSHRYARTTFHGRLLIVRRYQAGWAKAHIAAAMGISRKCVHTWIGVRFVDRSNRNLAYSVPRVSKVLCLLRCLSKMLRRRERDPATQPSTANCTRRSTPPRGGCMSQKIRQRTHMDRMAELSQGQRTFVSAGLSPMRPDSLGYAPQS